MEHFVPAAERDIERFKGQDLVTVAVPEILDQPIITEATCIPSRILSASRFASALPSFATILSKELLQKEIYFTLHLERVYSGKHQSPNLKIVYICRMSEEQELQ